ncbi:hypothetical protein ACT6QG_13335 [Xanthobacter sp. TB0136]|uniref:hypothetical protein n=1 Tax=Xanthobacter sp. TB0136 TaxID=3459177 RepID=UPI004039EEA9
MQIQLPVQQFRSRARHIMFSAVIAMAIAEYGTSVAHAGPEPVASASSASPAPSAGGSGGGGGGSPEPGSGWNYHLSVYGWAVSLKGDIGMRTLPTIPADVRFADLLKNMDGALMGSFFANDGEWLFLADLVYANLSRNRTLSALGGGNLGVGMKATIATSAVGRILPTGWEELDFAVMAGVRYMSIRGAVSLNTYMPFSAFSTSQRQWWVDPVVGFVAQWKIDRSWFIDAMADIGGFGVGSKLSSTGYLGIGYMWTESFSTSLGYRYLYEDYEHSAVSGPGTFRYKATMHGPTLAMGWKF